MARFVFKLEAVLRQRNHVEREKQRDLAARQKFLAECVEELSELRDRVRGATEELRQSHLVGELDLSFLTAHRRYMLASQRQAMAIAQKIAAAQKAAEEAQSQLAEAAKQRKILEKLREKQLARWQEENHRKEMIAQDEVNVQLGYESLRP
jgi:flagellar protein FliJ